MWNEISKLHVTRFKEFQQDLRVLQATCKTHKFEWLMESSEMLSQFHNVPKSLHYKFCEHCGALDTETEPMNGTEWSIYFDAHWDEYATRRGYTDT
jgi:hypothetical protein